MSFEKRKAVPLAAAFLIAVGIGSTATADTGVEIYSTNVSLNGGDIGLGGGDIRDSGVVVWNSSQGFVPAASVETGPIQSGTTASDVGLGQVENEAQVAESGDTLSGSLNLGGNDLTSSGTTVWDSTNGFVPAASVETNPIQSGTTASDVGLGQVENEAQVAESGDTLSGSLNLGGNDLTSSGTTVWDSTNGFVPASSVETGPIQSGTTASDVGLGQVENEAQVAESGDTLSGTLDLGGNDLTSSGTTVWDSTNGFVPASSVETGPIQSGTTASDVGLGQVENEAQVAESGDKMTGALNMTGNIITNVGSPVDGDDVATRNYVNNNDNDNYLPVNPPSQTVSFSNEDINFIDTIREDGTETNRIEFDETIGDDLQLHAESSVESTISMFSDGNILLKAGNPFSDSTDIESKLKIEEKTDDIILNGDVDNSNQCVVSDGTLNCDGSKNWIHDLNSTYEAYYSSQESPEVRAVYEGQTATSNGVANVSLPSHFSKTVSDTRPSLRVQATPHSLATVAVTERTDDYLVIESSKDVTVDYRVTGIREGYEDKQVVRKK